ncbi:MAG: hypothetical protein E7497_05210 [Ruminococcus sp.]|nr:hypothetical protein [Ruminococcus sp.]
MYECCNVKRFLKLLVIDAIIFGLCFIFMFIGKNITFSAEGNEKKHPFAITALIYNSTNIDTSVLEHNLSYLKENDLAVISASEFSDLLTDMKDLPENTVIIVTENNCEQPLNTLEKYGIEPLTQSELQKLCKKHNISVKELEAEEFFDLTE